MSAIRQICKGRVRLCTVEEGYSEKFGRFQGDELNGWIPAKEPLAGQEGDVITTYGDLTVTIKFDNSEQFDFPMEAVAEQLSKTGFQEGAARLKALPPAEFEGCFSRFQGDELNYWNDRKQMKNGKIGIITKVYGDDTVTMLFEDEEKWDFPFEAIEKMVKVRFVEDS